MLIALSPDQHVAVINHTDIYGRTTLIWAAIDGNVELIKVLLDRLTLDQQVAAISHADMRGNTALACAATSRHNRTTVALLNRLTLYQQVAAINKHTTAETYRALIQETQRKHLEFISHGLLHSATDEQLRIFGEVSKLPDRSSIDALRVRIFKEAPVSPAYERIKALHNGAFVRRAPAVAAWNAYRKGCQARAINELIDALSHNKAVPLITLTTPGALHKALLGAPFSNLLTLYKLATLKKKSSPVKAITSEIDSLIKAVTSELERQDSAGKSSIERTRDDEACLTSHGCHAGRSREIHELLTGYLAEATRAEAPCCIM